MSRGTVSVAPPSVIPRCQSTQRTCFLHCLSLQAEDEPHHVHGTACGKVWREVPWERLREKLQILDLTCDC